MRISDLAKEFNVSEQTVIDKLKALKLRAKDGAQELNKAVEIVLRDEFTPKKEKPKKKPEAAKSSSSKKETKASSSKTVKGIKAKEVAKPAPTKSKSVKEIKTKVITKTAVKDSLKSKISQKPEVKASVIEIKKEFPPEPQRPVPIVTPPKVESVKPQPVKIIPPAAVQPVITQPVKPQTPQATVAPAAPPVEKKIIRPEAPFVTVKPLLKKRKRPGHLDEAHPPSSFSQGGRFDQKTESQPFVPSTTAPENLRDLKSACRFPSRILPCAFSKKKM